MRLPVSFCATPCDGGHFETPPLPFQRRRSNRTEPGALRLKRTAIVRDALARRPRARMQRGATRSPLTFTDVASAPATPPVDGVATTAATVTACVTFTLSPPSASRTT